MPSTLFAFHSRTAAQRGLEQLALGSPQFAKVEAVGLGTTQLALGFTVTPARANGSFKPRLQPSDEPGRLNDLLQLRSSGCPRLGSVAGVGLVVVNLLQLAPLWTGLFRSHWPAIDQA